MINDSSAYEFKFKIIVSQLPKELNTEKFRSTPEVTIIKKMKENIH